MDKNFIRFSLQRMQGGIGETFPYECIMEASEKEISSFITECDSWQQEQADLICLKTDLTKLKGKKVLFIGDSLTADRLGYRGIVTKAAQIKACNAAISGATSTDMLRYLKDFIQSFQPDIISVMIGTNDSLIITDEKNLVSQEEYEKNLENILCISKKSGAKVIISTIPPTDEKRFKSQNKSNTNKNISEYCDIIRSQAIVQNVVLNDFAESVKDEPIEKIIESDGVHLTPYGQFCFAKKWCMVVLNNSLPEVID